VTLFEHDVEAAHDYLDRLEIRQGDRDAELEWTLRGGEREVRIYRSLRGHADGAEPPESAHGAEPTGSDQLLVFEGSTPAARLAGASDEASPVYRVSADIVSHYSIFARDDDGTWRLQLRVAAAPCSVGRWRRPPLGDSVEPAAATRGGLEPTLRLSA
jgi:hypothetical protein